MSFFIVPRTPGDGVVSLTLAQMLAYTNAVDGASCYVTDLPSGAKGLFQFDKANGIWIPGAPVLVDRNEALVGGVNNTNEQYLKNVRCPGGLIFVGLEFDFEYTLARSDATDAGTNANLRIGNLGTIADNVVGGSGYNAVTGTARSFGNDRRFRIASAANISNEGAVGTTSGSFVGIVSSGVIGDVNVGSTAADLFFSATVRLLAATGTTLPQCGQFNLWMLPSKKL